MDLLGLWKGVAWVNSNSIGSYWPKATTQKMDVMKIMTIRVHINLDIIPVAVGNPTYPKILLSCDTQPQGQKNF